MADGPVVALGRVGGFEVTAQGVWDVFNSRTDVVVRFPDLPDSTFTLSTKEGDNSIVTADFVARFANHLDQLKSQRDKYAAWLPSIRRNLANARAQQSKEFKEQPRLDALETARAPAAADGLDG